MKSAIFFYYKFFSSLVVGVSLSVVIAGACNASEPPAKNLERPNVVLVMTDDQGWGQTGYYGHPALKTPNLDAMAENGLRFDRFYAGAPVCSPTRATVLTGRSGDRTGVTSHGSALRLQEKTIAQALKSQGYIAAHFGKWHLSGFMGPGVPILSEDKYGPRSFGFDKWLSVTNFFDLNPLMSDVGLFKEYNGSSSTVIVDEALKFIAEQSNKNSPFFVVIWDGSPHRPFVATAADRAPFGNLNKKSQHHYGELRAFDRSIGKLRSGLRKLGLADNTIVWFNSDNGGLPGLNPDTVGGLRGYKGSLWEGGIRVPSIIEWPKVIKPKVTSFPASTMDIFPTLVDLMNLPNSVMLHPIDGISLYPLFTQNLYVRNTPIFIRHKNKGAMVESRYKLIAQSLSSEYFELYDLDNDIAEKNNIADSEPELFEEMTGRFLEWSASVNASEAGADYSEDLQSGSRALRRFWKDDPNYKPYLDELKQRPEYSAHL